VFNSDFLFIYLEISEKPTAHIILSWSWREYTLGPPINKVWFYFNTPV